MRTRCLSRDAELEPELVKLDCGGEDFGNATSLDGTSSTGVARPERDDEEEEDDWQIYIVVKSMTGESSGRSE